MVLPIFFFCISSQSFSQKHEVGIGIGASAYSGEIVQYLDVRNLRPSGQVYYRFNFSDVVSMKVAASLGVLYAADKKYNNAMAEYRNAEFTDSYNDLNILFEYNFLNYGYKNKQDRGKFSPYLTAGFGILNYNNDKSDPDHIVNTSFQPVIPFGGGIKYRIDAHWSFNWQFIATKTFTDDLDGIYNKSGYTKAIANPSTTDWYYYTGVSVGYIFWKIHCPE
ncbi:MAG: outer membrane beta-barrel protein [Cytophagales bacterium]|nr:outer membrane beta-barrel protein [Cytophaga sp.]